MAGLSGVQIARMRLQTQRLIGGSPDGVVDVVQNMLAIQAQDFRAAQWAIGVRLPSSTAQSVADALNSGQIVRSWPMRGTLHFVVAEDLQWMLKLTASRTLQSLSTRHRQLELDEATLQRARKVAVKTLRGNRRASREELIQAFESANISTENQRGLHLIGYLAQSGTLCWGPMHRTKQALVLLDEWISKPRTFEREEALGEFVRRYFASHGPATLKDFTWWTKLTVADAKIGLAVARDSLIELRSDDTSYWMTEDTYDEVDSNLPLAKRSVFALPAFDEHLLGYQNRMHVLPSNYANLIVPGNNGMFMPTIVSGGVVVGTWRRTKTKTKTETKMTIEPVPFNKLSVSEKSGFIASETKYRNFLELA